MYKGTFTPVLKLTAIWPLFALVIETNWDIIGIEVNTAFLNSETKETSYMSLPEGMVIL